jgi:hypothetical protein
VLPSEAWGWCFAAARASDRLDWRSAPSARRRCIRRLRRAFAAHAPPRLLFRRSTHESPRLDLLSNVFPPLIRQAGDAQAGLALDAGELGGADRAAELAVAAAATGEEADPAGVDQVQLDAHHRADAGLAGGLDEADGAVEPVAVAEAEAPDLQPGRDLDQVTG